MSWPNILAAKFVPCCKVFVNFLEAVTTCNNPYFLQIVLKSAPTAKKRIYTASLISALIVAYALFYLWEPPERAAER